MSMLKSLKIIIALVYLICFGISDLTSANQHTQTIDPNPSSPQFIDFMYSKPINGISISGQFTIYKGEFNSIIEPYGGRYMGTVRLTLTRLSDMRSTTQEFREVSFLSSQDCQNENPNDACILENPLFLELDYSEGFLPYVGLKIVDYDFDTKDELILITPFAYRGGPEYFIYDIIDTKEEFRIDYGSYFRVPGNVEFDYENKLMTYSYSSGACLSNNYYYKAEGLNGYKRYKAINYDQKEVSGTWICSRTVYLE
jgi:hypothetical protein